MEMLLQDLRYAFRMFRKSLGFTAVAILSLALGIGANTTIFTVVNAVLLNPLSVKNISQLVDLSTIDKKTTIALANAQKLPTSYLNCKDYRDQNDVLSGTSCFSFGGVTLSGQGEPQQLPALLVSANYFDVLGVTPALGRMFLPDEDQKPGGNPVVVISYALWAKQFGSDSGVLGRPLTLNAVPYTVVGVAPRNFKGTVAFLPAELVWIPISMNQQVLTGLGKDFFNERRFLGVFAFGRLKPGIPRERAQAAMQTIAAQLEKEYPKENQGRSIVLSPLSDAVVGVNLHGQFVLAGGMLMAIVGLVLLIACANLANLLLAQAVRREKEMSLRAALGASGSRLVRQMLTESVLLALIGGALGLLLADWGRNVLWSFRPSFLRPGSLDLSLDARVLAFTLGISLLTGLFFGLLPALKVARPDLIETLKVGGRGGTLGFGRNRLRSLLVVAEVALALVALVGAGLFVRSMQFVEQINPGFESQKLFVMAFDLGSQQYSPERGQQFYRDAVEHALSVPGVEAAAVAANLPLNGGFGRTVFHEGEQQMPGKRGTLTTIDNVSASYFQTLHIPLLRGREFNESDRETTTPVAIISEAMAKQFWPNEEALGKRFTFFGEDKLREVVGVVRDSAIITIGEDPLPVVYLPLLQNYSPAVTLQVRTSGKPEAVLGSVRSQVQSLDRNLAITNVNTIGELIDQGLWPARMGAALLSLFALLALLLASIGIYGVMAYSVSQRTQEVGIRMALGAQPLDVLKLIVGQGMLLASSGLIIGLLVAFALMRVLASLLFGVSAHDPLTFAGVTCRGRAAGLLRARAASHAGRSDRRAAIRMTRRPAFTASVLREVCNQLVTARKNPKRKSWSK
jgi:predicted permease